jgi:hypothetical protein
VARSGVALELLFAGLGAAGTVVLAVVGVLTYMESETGSSSADPSATTTTPESEPSTGTSAPVTTRAADLLLGRDVRPTTSEPCHAPGHADGSAWQLGDVVVAGRRLGPSYYCHLFAAGTGGVDFLLGKAYASLHVTIGLSDDSSARHRVRFELIADDTRYLAEPRELRLGQSAELTVDLTDVTRLRLRVSELGEQGGDDAPSRPLFGRAVVTPVQPTG